MSISDENARIAFELVRKGESADPFAAAVRATQMPIVISDPRQADNPIVFVNAAFLRLTGYERHEILGRNCRFLQGPETNRGDVERLREAIATKTPIELDLINYRKDGTTFWNRLLVSPVFDDEGQLSFYYASQFDVTVERERARLEKERTDLETEVARRDAEIVASEERLKIALKAGRMGSWSLDLQSQKLIASDVCKENFGRPATEPFTYDQLSAAVAPEDRDMREEAIQTAVASGQMLDVEYRLLTPSGNERWIAIRGQPYYRADGTPLSIVGVSQDITDRKRSDEHRALLANELSHRVKNSLAMVQAVISQTLRRASSLEEARDTLDARIVAMSAANDLLVSECWEGASIRDLLRSSLAPFEIADYAQFQMIGPDLTLSPNMAASLALGIHEMATNAAKYGALSRAAGRVSIAWTIDASARPKTLRLTWTESGGPPVVAPTKLGFGSRLIERAFSQNKGGAATIDYSPGGVVVSIAMPILDEEASA